MQSQPRHILFTLLCLACFSFGLVSPAQSATKENILFGDWYGQVDEDVMTGKKDYYIFSYSENALQGWLKENRLLLGYSNGFYLRANDVGLASEVKHTSYGYHKIQRCRLKVDDNSPKTFEFNVWDKNNDGMSLANHEDKKQKKLIQMMKAGNTLLFEVELFMTKGEKQIARFGLKGFTKAINWLQKNSQ